MYPFVVRLFARRLFSNSAPAGSIELEARRYRGFRKYVVILGSFLALAGATPAHADNPIPAENQFPGTTQWRVTKPANDINKQIKGYASATSVNKGGSIVFRVTVTPAQAFTIDIYRMGWYQGLGGRLMRHVDALAGTSQPACPVDAATGAISCAWADAYTLDVPTSWTTGIYLALLTNAEGYQNYITFVVRDDDHVGGLIYQQAVTTYQAYNNYPHDNVTGKSLYDYNSYGANTVAGSTRAVKVSFDRPYSDEPWQYHGSGQFMSWEMYFVRWAERLGYEISYTTDIDTHTHPERLKNARGFLSVGHDEYWSKEMYDGAIAARDAGVGLAFFGANAIYMQIRLESSPAGVSNRVVVLYRDTALDPVKGPTATIAWRNLGRPEQQLIGVQYITWLDTLQRPYAPHIITNSGNWVYAGTSFQENDSVPGLVGYEIDQVMSGYPLPTAQPGSFAVLSRSPIIDFRNQTHESNSTIYQALSGAWVFAAGTIGWSWGLDKSDVVDPRIQKTTENILGRFLGDAPVVAPAAPSALVANAAGSTAINLSWTDNSSDEDGFRIERSTSSTFDTVTTSTVAANVTSFVDSDLLAATSYHYRVKAVKSSTSSAYSNNATATTAAAPVVAPAAPSALVANAAGSTAINLSWTDNSSDEDGFRIERSTSSTFDTVTTSTVAANVTSFVDSDLLAATSYHYRVKAVKSSTSSAYSNNATATTAAAPVVAPAAPSAVKAKYGGNTKNFFVMVSWTDNAANESGFVIERSIDGVTFTALTTVPANSLSFKDIKVAARTTYHYRVKAVNNAGSSQWSNIAVVSTK